MNDSTMQKVKFTDVEQVQPPVNETVVPVSGGGRAMIQSSPIARIFLPVAIFAVLAGVGTGYLLSTKLSFPTKQSATQGGKTTTPVAQSIKVGDTFGSKDDSTFKDSAEGVLLVGGVNGEGSYHVVREGGESQNVYLTSSVVDLGLFVNHKVTVRGETFKAQKAGWLMDVGQVKILELNAQLPAWAQKALEKQEKSAGGSQ
ncbi:MAG TPA: hypothetical protein DCX25_03490 [Candidatus Pacebacteria bacterium]|nr:MAG: hypothetical protein UX00_C0008G0051 [Microgenomates group bacterium GW2011_GWB1_45_17]KKU23888.1 MAG: hypothetical protein UX35_C0003G0024 [Microgenomates group bacterium GW2011_GWA1_46_15]KKU24719.1 MAG: hypothetical protein UX36_C0001G0336 [Microgenomates group bacterium GW2011_GWC1_46_15]HAV15367.1 hypothetical protein [Candidatus Paceibacterota bacterium]HCR11575.1 hypothetical protein [Candidatus Paceibacterota bacterium]